MKVTHVCSPVSATVCEAPVFSSGASGVAVEPFCSTIVNSEIVYQCQSEVLPEERTTLLCGEDGRWNPDPQGLCTGKSYWTVLAYFYISSVLTPYILATPGQTLSTPAVVTITAIVCLITGTLLGALLTVCISRWNKKGHSSKPAPNTQEQQQAAAVYEEVDMRNKKIELKENMAYRPVKQGQKIELKENEAYGPVKQDQEFELKENVAYGPVKPNKTEWYISVSPV